MGQSSEQNAGANRRRGSGGEGSERGSSQSEVKLFRSHEAHQFNEDVLSEAHAQFWIERANRYLEEGHSRNEAAILATEDFHNALREQARRKNIAEAREQDKIREQIARFEREDEALRATQTGRRRRKGQAEGQKQLEEQTAYQNQLADQLARSPGGRRRRAGLKEREEERIARESREHIEYLRRYG